MYLVENNKVFICMCLIVAVFMLGYPIFTYQTVDYVTIHVEEKAKEIKGFGKNIRSVYMIHCKNESFKCTDNIFFFKFNSTDVYRNLKVGKKYQVKVNEIRSPFFSMFRNIIEITRPL